MTTSSVIKVDADVRFTINATPEGPWVAVCDLLGLTVQSNTWVELMEDIGEVLEFMLTDLLREGHLDQFLTQHGWTCQRPLMHSSRDDDVPTPRFDIPFIPTLVRHDDSPQTLPA